MTQVHLRTLKTAALVLLALAAVHAAVGFLLVPWLAQRHLPPLLEQRLGRDVRVGEFRANPYLLTFEARQVVVQGRHGQPMLAIDRVFADASASGLPRGTWTIDSVQLNGVEANLVLQEDGDLNFADAAAHWSRSAGDATDGAAPAFDVEQLTVSDARLSFTDLQGPGDARVVIAPIRLHAQNLSTSADEKPATYELTAALPEGGSLQAAGRLAVQPALAGSGRLQLAGLQARSLLPFLRERLGLADLRAAVDASARYAHGPAQPLRWRDASLAASGVLVARPGEPVPVLQAARVAVQDAALDPAGRSVTVKLLRAETGRVSIAGTQPAQDEAHAEAAPEGGPWKVVVERVEVAGLGGRYAPLDGKAPQVEVESLDGHLRLAMTLGSEAPQVVASDVDAQLERATWSQAGGPPGVRISAAEVADGRFDLAARRVGAAKLVVSGSTSLVRDARGQLVFPGLSTSPSPAPGAAPDDASPWQYAVDLLELPAVAFDFSDRTVQPPLHLRGTLQGRAAPVASGAPAQFDARLDLKAGGNLTATGTLAAGAAQVRAKVEARDVALRPFQPLLERVAAVELRSGSASGTADLRYGRGGALSLQGNLRVADARLEEAASGDPVLSWKQLDVQGASLDLGARRFSAQEISVQAPVAKVVVSQDRELNLVQLLEHDDDPAAAPGGPSPRGGGFAFEVGQVRLRDGEVDFSDLSLVLPFSTTVKGLDGTIVGISGDPSRRARVKAEGSIEPYGSATVSGSLVPVAPRRFTDLRAEFSNVRVPPLSPYTATFAGRKVESGKLWLDLRYRVEQGELLGRNEIRLEDFELGERVQAPDAMDIPLDMVVALLTDGDGRIRLSVPVTGELGNPQFSVASAVRQALANVLQRVATAPFRALADLFDADAQSVAGIDFRPGSAQLRPEEVEKLDALTHALRERPRLQLVVVGPYDPQLDTRALQREQARRALARALGHDAGPRQDPAPVAFDDPATRRALEGMLRAAAGADAVEELRRQFAGRSGRAMYRAMFERVAAAQPLPATRPQVLAVDRAREIVDYLRRQGIDAARLSTGRLADVRAGDDGDVTSRLQVAAAGSSG